MGGKDDRERRNLVVYRASAGSGKTFTLVSEYLSLAIRESLAAGGGAGARGRGFGRTLAVTFTNKATAEMKTRILDALYDISHGRRGGAGYSAKIRELLGGALSEEAAARAAGDVLRGVLHNYDSFDVKTIDSFYQGIAGGIALMAGLGSGLETRTDEEAATDSAVERIAGGAAAADGAEGERRLRMLYRYIEDHIEEEASWDFRRDLKEFGRNVCREAYMMNAERASAFFDGEEADRYAGAIRALARGCAEEAGRLADGFMKTAERLGVGPGDIKGGDRLYGYLRALREGDLKGAEKARTKTVAGLAEGPGGWTYAERDRRYDGSKARAIGEELFPAFREAERRLEALRREANSAELTLANMNDMRMLSMIDEEVKRESRESGRILLAKSLELIRNAIRSEEDASFVFELAGKRYSHVMLDEAQDTSRMQWGNLSGFLLNVVSEAGGRSVVVGDVKQSIYRWRNGDWKILAGLAEEGGGGLFRGKTEVRTLPSNRRSAPAIVRFNGAFFTAAAAALDARVPSYCGNTGRRLSALYRDAAQEPARGGAGGYVQIDIIEPEGGGGSRGRGGAGLERARLDILAANIARLHDGGLPYSRMAVLARRNSELAAVAEYARENGLPYKINTSEAYSAAGARSVRMITAAMRAVHGHARNAPDALSAFYLARECASLEQGDAFDPQEFYGGAAPAPEHGAGLLPEGLARNMDYLSELPAGQLALELADILGIGRTGNESAHIYKFLDYADGYPPEDACDIGKFLEDWEAEAPKQKITVTEPDGITAMTIHSAKGLEFHTVFVPFCDWKLVPDSGRGLMWCVPKVKPYSEAPLLPIDYRQKAKDSIYAEDYGEENFDILADNLNMLYVAFTRPKANLFAELAAPSRSGEAKITGARISDTVAEVAGGAAFRESARMEARRLETDAEGAAYVERMSCGEPDTRCEEEGGEAGRFSLRGESTDVPFGTQAG